MKKFVCLLLTIALCLTCTAFAAPAPVSTLKDADWVDGTNLLCLRQSAGYCLADITGAPLTEPVYYDSFYHEYGYITGARVSEDDFQTYGLLNSAAQEITPFEYGDVEILNQYWAVGIRLTDGAADNYDYKSYSDEEYYLIDTVDIYYLPDAACVGTLPRANYADARANARTINILDRSTDKATCYDAQFNVLATGLSDIYDDDYATFDLQTFRDNGQYGLVDAEGSVVMQPAYSYIYLDKPEAKYVTVSTGGDYEGLCDIYGNLIVPVEYDEVDYSYYAPFNGVDTRAYVSDGYICVVKDGKLGYVDTQGNVTCEPKYSAELLENYGVSALFTDMAGNINILSADGVETMIEGYDVRSLDYSSGRYYEIVDADYNRGMIDCYGQTIFPCQYDSVDLSGDGRYVLISSDYGEVCEIYDLSGDAAAPVAEEAPAAEAPAEAEVIPAEIAPVKGSGKKAPVMVAPAEDAAPTDAPTAEAPTAETPAEAPAADASPVAATLDSAITLLNSDAAANSAAVISLLKSATIMLDGSDAAGVIGSAITLLESDPAANAASVVTLLESAKTML